MRTKGEKARCRKPILLKEKTKENKLIYIFRSLTVIHDQKSK